MATVGENFKRIRKDKGITQEGIFKALGFKRQSNVSLLERSKRLPKPRTIRRMAAALDCETWELLENVQTPHDELRQVGVPQSRTGSPSSVKSTSKRRGSTLALSGDQTDNTDSVPSTSREVDRPALAVIEQLTREREAERTRGTRKPPAAARRPAARRSARVPSHRR